MDVKPDITAELYPAYYLRRVDVVALRVRILAAVERFGVLRSGSFEAGARRSEHDTRVGAAVADPVPQRLIAATCVKARTALAKQGVDGQKKNENLLPVDHSRVSACLLNRATRPMIKLTQQLFYYTDARPASRGRRVSRQRSSRRRRTTALPRLSRCVSPYSIHPAYHCSLTGFVCTYKSPSSPPSSTLFCLRETLGET